MTRVAAIVGPTAAGKSAVAVEVAEQLGAEIVSIDSMQSYQGMDVGTDKATAEMRARVRHHLLDLWPPSYDPTVAEFQTHARGAIDEIAHKGLLPLLVGGSGLYFRAVVDELDFPPADPDVRASLEAEADRVGTGTLHARLTALDPVAAARVEPGNTRRIVRALEVITITGRRFSANDSWDRYESRYELVVAGITRPREELYARIAARAEEMIDAGLVEEARGLEQVGLSRTARLALGYRQVLTSDASNREVLAAEIARATKRFARRQESWFRADPRVVWFDGADPTVVDKLMAHFRGGWKVA